MPTDSKSSHGSSGAFHPDLLGSSESLRYRPRRLDTEQLSTGLTCQFLADDSNLGPFAVLDLSPTGLAMDPGENCVLAPGSSVSDLEVSFGGDRIWTGSAQSIYQVDGASPRTGLRFTSGLFDLQLLQLSDSIVETQLALTLEQDAKYEALLPAAWRAKVALVRHLLKGAREMVEAAESQLKTGNPRRETEERALFHRIFDRWGPIYHERLCSLHRLSKTFEGSSRELARAYATRELLSLVRPCPMHGRAYEKPLGYAGDYRMMILMLQESYEGSGIYSRFLHHVSKNYTFGKMVTAREAAIRRVIRQTITEDRPVRILSLACGPAIELQNLIREIDTVHQPIELILIDQSEETLQYCHEAVSREILKRGADFASKVNLNCLHLSVRQILQPNSAQEKTFIEDNLLGVDLIYSAGLYDYLPQSIAKKLTRRLYEYLRPGGRLWIGNLAECPDTTWMMEHVLAWHLEYRTPETMLALTDGIKPEPLARSIETDETEHCLFLNAVTPA